MTLPVHTCRQFRLLIAGSRHASLEMLHTARQAVARAKTNGWLVLVGDNPKGVDAAVINACDALGVNVIVFGVTEHPRKGSRQPGSHWRVDARHTIDDEFIPAVAYTERDRYMVDLCDRAFFIHDGKSPGTRAGYEYALQSGKPADLRTFAAAQPNRQPPQPAQPPVKPVSIPAPHTVELIVEVSELPDHQTYQGTMGLRALDGAGKLLYDARQTLQTEASTADSARMQTLIAALERLTVRLKTDTAAYRLYIYQNSKNVDGWFAHHWKRNVPGVQRLASRIDELLKTFPDICWTKEPRPQLQSRLSKLAKGGEAHR